MVEMELTRGPTAHTSVELVNGSPDIDLARDEAGHVDMRIALGEVGE